MYKLFSIKVINEVLELLCGILLWFFIGCGVGYTFKTNPYFTCFSFAFIIYMMYKQYLMERDKNE